MADPRPSLFPETQWSLIVAAQQSGQTPQVSAALNQLCQMYWYPIYALIRRRGKSEADASDLTQLLFARLCRGELWNRMEKREGVKLRAFLLNTVNWVLSSEHRREAAERRGGGEKPVSLDAVQAEKWLAAETTGEGSPEEEFDRRWALQLVRCATHRLEKEWVGEGDPARKAEFDALRPFMTQPPETGEYESAGQRIARSPDWVKQNVKRLRKQFGKAMRQEIAETLSHPDEERIADELRVLFDALSGR